MSTDAAPPKLAAAGLSPERLSALLEKTSRTFALAIPLLPEPTRRQVGLAYLLFRIADTFEDAERWPRQRQLAALAELERLLGDDGASADAAVADWLEDPPCEHDGYLELLAASGEVLAAFRALEPPARRLVHRHTLRTVQGMAGFVRRKDDGGALRLRDLADLKDYCYVVAGIVGEMLTGLFLLGRAWLRPAAPRLRRRAARFGEALQLVNILKDAAVDAHHGRFFLPADCPREVVFDLARRDLESATGYVQALHRFRAPRGVVAFTAQPLLLARLALDRVERHGPGSKVPREQVHEQLAALEAALERGECPV
jgi:farnesyl-diphosphate farnesyltransferase